MSSMSAEYSEAHRVFLTYIRAVKQISADDLLEKFVMLAEHFEIDVPKPMEAMRDFIAQINVQIARAYFKIASIRDQESDVQLYVFINTKSDEVIQACTSYTAPELDTIKKIIDLIIQSSDYAFALPHGNARQQVATSLKQKAGESDSFIRRLVDDGWINLTDQRRLVLSSASLAELSTYLQDRFGIFSTADTSGDILQCTVCSGIVTLGKKCHNVECPTAFHLKCYSVFSRDNQVCPNQMCSEPLAGVIDVGTSLTRTDGS